MEQMTVRINEEECVIMPAPKGAFVIGDHFICPCFVQYMAVSADAESLNDNDTSVGLNAYPLSYSDGDWQVQWSEHEEFFTNVANFILDSLYEECVGNGYGSKRALTMLYQEFKSHDTPFDYSAIEWFKKKFKEHNITKADFDVFA